MGATSETLIKGVVLGFGSRKAVDGGIPLGMASVVLGSPAEAS